MSEKLDIVKLWIEKADHDLGTAKVTFLHIPKFKDTIAFHCQQSVEKYLKSYLLFLDIQFKRSHNLTYLLGLLSTKESVSNEMYDKAADLEDFAVEIRYPETEIMLSDQDIEIAISIGLFFRQYVLTKMNLKIELDDIN